MLRAPNEQCLLRAFGDVGPIGIPFAPEGLEAFSEQEGHHKEDLRVSVGESLEERPRAKTGTDDPKADPPKRDVHHHPFLIMVQFHYCPRTGTLTARDDRLRSLQPGR